MKKSLGEGSQETDILTWMHRCALELVGQGGLGYSFDPEMNGKHNEYAQALKEFMSVFLCIQRVFYLLTNVVLNTGQRYTLFPWSGRFGASFNPLLPLSPNLCYVWPSTTYLPRGSKK